MNFFCLLSCASHNMNVGTSLRRDFLDFASFPWRLLDEVSDGDRLRCWYLLLLISSFISVDCSSSESSSNLIILLVCFGGAEVLCRRLFEWPDSYDAFIFSCGSHRDAGCAFVFTDNESVV
ncbi:hypothetical protein I7I48_04255 [Histoplasma ohiense]|nr:hypothetical protein I7I48_04255 [Histoplasma ohiense (nom. inval.)]